MDIFFDYLDRFRLTTPKRRVHIAIAGTEGGNQEDPYRVGMSTVAEGDDRILIEVRDPSLVEKEPVTSLYISVKFVEVLCHEMVHAMQSLTDRKPDFFSRIKHNKRDNNEKYFFNGSEVEARVLESFYAHVYGWKLMDSCQDDSDRK